MVEFQHGKLLIWGTLLSPNMGYPKVGDFAESAQEATVRFKVQPATPPTQFSDFQLNEANSSNQSTVPPSDFPTVFSHEPAPSTSPTPTASTCRIAKAVSLSPLPSVSKQGTTDARSSRPDSAKAAENGFGLRWKKLSWPHSPPH